MIESLHENLLSVTIRIGEASKPLEQDFGDQLRATPRAIAYPPCHEHAYMHFFLRNALLHLDIKLSEIMSPPLLMEKSKMMGRPRP